jgi:hypothetical protein
MALITFSPLETKAPEHTEKKFLPSADHAIKTNTKNIRRAHMEHNSLEEITEVLLPASIATLNTGHRILSGRLGNLRLLMNAVRAIRRS